jgi:hypothetical protein
MNDLQEEIDDKESVQRGMKEIKNFCIQIATAYSIIYQEQSQLTPQIKAIVYSYDSHTYYIYGNDEKFIIYLLPRLEKYFAHLKIICDDLPTFKIEHEVIDNDNYSIEVKFNYEEKIDKKPSYKSQLISI